MTPTDTLPHWGLLLHGVDPQKEQALPTPAPRSPLPPWGMFDEEPMTLENQVVASVKAMQAVDAALGLDSLTVRIPKSLRDQLELLATREGMPLVAFLRKTLADFASDALRPVPGIHNTEEVCRG